MTRPTVLDMDLVVVPRDAAEDIDATIKEFGHWHHLNEMTIAKGMVPSDSEIDIEVMAFNKIKRAMLSASPYPTAWDDVRKYVEKLEVEAKCDEEYLDLVKDKYRSAEARIAELEAELASLADLYGDEEKPRYTTRRLRMEVERAKAAAGIRIAELEKRLSDAERVIEPFAKVKTADGYPDGFLRIPDEHGMLFNATDALGETTNWEPVVSIGHLRAARAYMEGK